MPLTVLSTGQIRATFGDFSHVSQAGGAIVINPPWPASNIVTVQIPCLVGVPTYGGKAFNGKVPCHTGIAQPLADAFADIQQHGLDDRILFWTGSWVPRHKSWNPVRGLSAHSWGIAFDINHQWNAYGQPPAAVGAMGCVRELVPVFEAHGFAWGGYFGTPDGMHFEYAVP